MHVYELCMYVYDLSMNVYELYMHVYELYIYMYVGLYPHADIGNDQSNRKLLISTYFPQLLLLFHCPSTICAHAHVFCTYMLFYESYPHVSITPYYIYLTYNTANSLQYLNTTVHIYTSNCARLI